MFMNRLTAILLALILLPASSGLAQSVIVGRILGERFPGSTEPMPFTALYCFSSQTGPGREARGFRSWETAPVGWYRLATDAGDHTLLFTQPAHYFRPLC